MATYNYKDLFDKYESFYDSIYYVYVGDRDIVNSKKSIYTIDDLYVELSCEYKANIATFTIIGAFDEEGKSFAVDEAKKYIMLGSSVKIEMGHGTSVREVFRGYIARVAFNYDKDSARAPGIAITAMDVKGIMMVNCYSKRLSAKYYSDAVQEIFNSMTYQSLITSQIVTSYEVSATPDKSMIPGTGALGGAAGGLGSMAGGLGGAVGGLSSVTDSLGSMATGALGSVAQGAVSSVTGNLGSSAQEALSGATGAIGTAGDLTDAAGSLSSVAGSLSSGSIPGAGSLPTSGLSSATGAASAAGAVIPDLPNDRIEMNCESDYDFIVKAAKRFNYEFFSLGGYVYFRKAKENAAVLMEINPSCVIYSYNIEYDLTGIVGAVEVRGIDAAKGSVITAKRKNSNKLSLGSKAKSLVSKQTKVYFDPSADTKESADQKAESLMESISYRLASLEMEIAGLPEIIPGSYIQISGIGSAISNTYYITETAHYINHEGTYITKIIGKAATIADGNSPLGGIGGLGAASSIAGSIGSGLGDIGSMAGSLPF
ncbi:hypothetical protein SAMN02910276_00030 [Butyrivibrio sp. Su6]|uniref:phage late control D family protein n=1 Tax=Butyrivibrio sp. Su6 TaxID=1520810 RepID=UPI00089E6D54|nr:hypothetical protein [Butyrivibrio sp. Su6]SEF39189.1 hypothetical protein SAMN02910276_00030 [Butyrivibrio sp. Su6]